MIAAGLVLASLFAAVEAAPGPVTRVDVRGNTRTREDTITDLVPRELPTTFSAFDLEELDRRVRNLGIFDEVTVAREGEALVVTVREKVTLTPNLNFSTGETWRDSYVLVGATEYNLGGRAAALGVWGSWEQRGPNGGVIYEQHTFHPRRWGLYLEAYYTTADFRFGDGDEGWVRRWVGLDTGFRAPAVYDWPVKVAVGAFALREWLTDVKGPAPDGGVWTGVVASVERDRLAFDDVAPHGYRVRLETWPGWLWPAGAPRHAVKLTLLGSLPLAPTIVLAGRGVAEAVASGNPNQSALLGSLAGVRGLADAFYRNRSQAYVNLELRAAVRVAARWALQGVAFGDAAVFEAMDANGRPGAAAHAIAAGGGVRVLPTFLTSLLLRVDVARLLRPEGSWFVQVGIDQYF